MRNTCKRIQVRSDTGKACSGGCIKEEKHVPVDAQKEEKHVPVDA
ncbi:hypothetical protein RHOM_03250 [Roseburia hominis A2-183]|uniref:Uncharacterized protein n=1 Tax=Roseburia hominis (strain DSM 16839 / JCM 17582 / NCIMB 14029 / A2-183) TaxID=585394 RepID=G2T0U0_ROSHA|nr:hypothetical protein RHOM_03250 [Roseburia hominis A2-183]